MQIKKSELNTQELASFASLFKSTYLQFKGKSPAKFDHKNREPIFYLYEKSAEYASSSSSTKCFSSTECKKFRTSLFFTSFTTLVWWGGGGYYRVIKPNPG